MSTYYFEKITENIDRNIDDTCILMTIIFLFLKDISYQITPFFSPGKVHGTLLIKRWWHIDYRKRPN